ncbi:MAG: FtsW/RodA/SpoVE family cell cycle protein [Candidatus Woesebacteria bacterium]|nr:FtsW/RodA/SpoVE family cell cycle protein [Candidatus Woesebacteria bacterium]
MRSLSSFLFKDTTLSISVLFLIVFGVVILSSLDIHLFPLYFVYIVVALAAFWFFSQVDFDIISLFSKHFYIASIALLLMTLIIGRVTRGTFRWIPIGPLSLQPAEIVRPLLLIFFANYMTKGDINLKKIFKSVGLLAIPVILILVQPSLGVSALTVIGFFGVLIASKFNKKYLLVGLAGIIILLPLLWNLLASYQKQRILTFLEPTSDPLGAGYNSLQSTIAVGSGKIFGTGLGKGIQTQLAFLPEKQTDFIFAATAEELGIIGAGLILVVSFIILFRLTHFMENAVSPAARAYISGFFLIYLVQIFVHVGMNMGMLPITGVPFPLLSAGGSSLLATMAGLGIALGAYKR